MALYMGIEIDTALTDKMLNEDAEYRLKQYRSYLDSDTNVRAALSMDILKTGEALITLRKALSNLEDGF